MSGIGQSDKFESSLKENGFKIENSLIYPDHHQYNRKDIKKIYDISKSYEKYTIITTEKDYARLNDINDTQSKLRNIIDIFEMEITFENNETLEEFLQNRK